MPKVWRRHQEDKQAFRKKYAVVSKEREGYIREILLDEKILRIYCDASTHANQGLYGLASAIVGFGSVHVKTKKIYSKHVGRSTYAECKSVEFILSYLLEYLKSLSALPDKVIIYSDYNLIEDVLTEGKTPKEIVEVVHLMQAHLEKIQNTIKIPVDLKFIGTDKKNNPYYTAAHNAARKVIGK